MKLLTSLFFIFCFFPYLKIIPNLDTQPGALILGSLLMFIYIYFDKKINKKLIIILLLTFGTIVFLDYSKLFESLRGILSYYSIGIITYSTYKSLKNRFLIKRILEYSINVWFICGLIQTIYKRNFLEFMVNGMRTSDSRGVTSLAPEPTFYGITCVFLLILVVEVVEKNKTKIFLEMNLLIQIFFFSKSSMTILFLFILIGIIFLTKMSLKYFTFGLVSVFTIHLFVTNFLINSRVYSLYNKVMTKSIKNIFYEDASLNARLSHIYYSFLGSLENYLLPNGVVEWSNFTALKEGTNEYFYTFLKDESNRIMSGFGGIIYELGIIGIFLIIFIMCILIKGLKHKELSIFLFIIYFSAIQISNPFLGVILGLALYNFEEKNKNEKIKSDDCCRNKTRNYKVGSSNR